jgi:A/G-specific adenine glycosylase
VNFSHKLIQWYLNNKRDLPWRSTDDPYTIWVSEIILQQTRVNQGVDYFNRFISAYPDIQTLALANEKDVLKQWQGLGYYSRARNLHKASQFILEKSNGIFPSGYDEVLALPGVGEYTAAAVLSFAYGKNYPVVDGNVMRVLSRIFGLDMPLNTQKGKKTITAKASELMDNKDPRNFNQAIMEFGALHCTPLNPGCSDCIFNKNCFAFQNGQVHELPVKKKLPVKRIRHLNYVILFYKTKKDVYFLLRKRTNNDIWQNMYDFPVIETRKKIAMGLLQTLASTVLFNNNPTLLKNSGLNLKHILTHQIIQARFFFVETENRSAFNKMSTSLKVPYEIASHDTIIHFPIPRLIEKFFEKKHHLFGNN